jgi:hypothetical protein
MLVLLVDNDTVMSISLAVIGTCNIQRACRMCCSQLHCELFSNLLLNLVLCVNERQAYHTIMPVCFFGCSHLTAFESFCMFP